MSLKLHNIGPVNLRSTALYLAAALLLLFFGFSHAAATGNPFLNPAFFMSSPHNVGNSIADLNDFDESPITLGDDGNASEKCGFWNCSAWSMSANNGRGEYCSGFWNCTAWNGPTCSNYSCTAWSQSATARRDGYCSGGWNCSVFNGGVCQSWKCLQFTFEATTNDLAYVCTGLWNCAKWNGTNCSLWNCTAWTASAATDTDHFCSGSWNCLASNNSICSSWNCTAWGSGTAGDTLDRYCSGVINCTSWNGSRCSNWNCTAMSVATTTTRDVYCGSFNCTSWNEETKTCGTWNCTKWTESGNASRDFYCSGSYNCLVWKPFDFIPPTINSVTAYPDPVVIGNNITITANVTDNINVSSSNVQINGTNYTMTKNGSTTIWYYVYNTSALSPGPYNYTVYANDTSKNNATPQIGNFTIILAPSYDFTVTPSSDAFAVVNNTYVDRNYTLNNTGNQLLSISCASNTSWAYNITACPSSLAVGTTANVTFRFNATGQPAGNPQVLLNFTDANAGTRNVTADVTIALFPLYNFTVSPSIDNFSVVNNTYIDRNYTLTNTGNQLLSISCASNATWAYNITACPVSLSAGSSTDVTFRFNATGRAAGTEYVRINFTDANAGTRNVTANVTITALAIYNFTATPALDNFSVVNNTYADRNYNLTNTGNQLLSINCSSNVSWAYNITACPVSLSAGSSANVTFRYNATGRAVAVEYVRINFTDANAGTRNVTATVNITPPPLNATLTTDLTEAEACGTVYYKVELFDSNGSYVDSTVNVEIRNTTGFIWNTVNTTTTGGIYLDSWIIPWDVDFGDWSVRALASGVLGEVSFIMGLGTSTLPQRIDIVFNPDKLVYRQDDDIQMNFTPINQVGEKMTGLLPSGIVIKLDTTDVTVNVTEYNGVYVYMHTAKLAVGQHIMTATVGDVMAGRAFSAK